MRVGGGFRRIGEMHMKHCCIEAEIKVVLLMALSGLD